MSDNESAPGSLRQKDVQNEACTACRAVKRRCLNGGKGTVCTRCAKQGLVCEYLQQKRGRKPGSGAPRKRRAGEDSIEPVGAVDRSASSAVDTPSGANDWLLADLLRTQAEGTALPPPPPPVNGHSALPTFSPFASTSMSAFAALPHHSAAQHLPGGPSPAASHNSAHSVPPGPAATTSPCGAPATGGFSLRKLIQENQPNNGDADEPRHSLADAFAPRSANALAKKPERKFVDVVEAGVLPAAQAPALFDFYFAHLNPMTSLLDPALHTADFCRSRSPFLFTAILTVASKVAHPTLYPSALQYAKALLGQAFEAGTNTLELVQALATLVFWQDPEDPSGARKLAYAIRCAFELNIHKRGKRPLPDDEMQLRRALNPERTWLYLTIADHRFSTQRGLPKMIDNSYRSDAIPWLLEHDAQKLCPQETGLAPLIELGRILDTFAVLIAPEEGLPSLELLRCLERDVEAWRSNWSLERASLPLQPAQTSLVRFYGAVLQFQLLELNLHISIKRSSSLDAFDPRADVRSTPLVVFGGCIKAAIRVLDIKERELRFMVYSFDSMWVGAASASIWLAQNLSGMEPADKAASLSALNRLQSACAEVSNGSQSMAAYTSRLLLHLLQKVQDGEAAAAAASAATSSDGQASAPPPGGLGTDSSLASSSVQAPSYVKASLSAPSWSVDPSARASAGVGIFNGGGSGGGMFGASAGATPRREVSQPMWATQMPDPSGSETPGQQSAQFDFLGAMMPPMQNMGEDLPFPAADDALWQSLFPLSFDFEST
ncbi:hypothetical protein JCM9279_005546 [Rhodotorula babjevae]